MNAEIQFTGEIITDGYGDYRLARCMAHVGTLYNAGDNVFQSDKITNLLCQDIPVPIDPNTPQHPKTGWVYIQFADKRLKMFLNFLDETDEYYRTRLTG
jgi:hypothetical protein